MGRQYSKTTITNYSDEKLKAIQKWILEDRVYYLKNKKPDKINCLTLSKGFISWIDIYIIENLPIYLMINIRIKKEFDDAHGKVFLQI